MAHFFLLDIIGFIYPSCRIFLPIIQAPALTKTMDNKAPISRIALDIIYNILNFKYNLSYFKLN